MLKLMKKEDGFSTPYTCMNAIKKGGIETKLSMVLMGFGNKLCPQTEDQRSFISGSGSCIPGIYAGERHWLFEYVGLSGQRSAEGSLG